jgi:anti-sigma28 factor (negative regulator of flagellin synthesis)
MLVLTVKGQKHGSVKARESVRTKTLNFHGDKLKLSKTSRLLKKVASLPKARREKILAVRYQLDTGKYSIDDRLNAATDRLIENLFTKEIKENEVKSTTRRRQK